MTRGAMVLAALYRAGGEFVRGEQMAQRGKVPAAGVAAAVAALAALGYSIESHPHHGYCLRGTPDRLMADDLTARLLALRDQAESRIQFAPTGRPSVIGSEILVFEETASTNDVVESLARTGGRDGLVVFAETQTRGRGRHGRTWASPRGKGLWFSILLRPKLPLSAAPRITVAASVAVARAVRQATGLEARIKWPNDVMVNGRKIAGILTELSAAGDEVVAAILGIGIDVNCRHEDFPAAVAATASSLAIETGRQQDRAELAADILEALEAGYAAAHGEFQAVVEEWARLSTTLGKQLVVKLGRRRIEGHAQALDADGALLLRKDNGQVERIVGGEVEGEI